MRIHRRRRSAGGDCGYAMVALLVALSIMAVMLSMALPVWTTAARREKEAELVFRGEQYARAIAKFQQKYGNAAPPSIDVLVDEKFLRKKYKDPITGDDFQVLTPGMPIPGVDVTAPPGRGGRGTPAQQRAEQARQQVQERQQRADQMRQQLEEVARRTGGIPRSAQVAFGGNGRGGAVIGVVSKSTDRSLRLYNGQDNYNEWVFMGTQQSNQAGGGARGGAPGGRGGRAGVPGAPPGRGGRMSPPPTGRRGASPFPPPGGGRRGRGGAPEQ